MSTNEDCPVNIGYLRCLGYGPDYHVSPVKTPEQSQDFLPEDAEILGYATHQYDFGINKANVHLQVLVTSSDQRPLVYMWKFIKKNGAEAGLTARKNRDKVWVVPFASSDDISERIKSVWKDIPPVSPLVSRIQAVYNIIKK
jgi:hypothetical protein